MTQREQQNSLFSLKVGRLAEGVHMPSAEAEKRKKKNQEGETEADFWKKKEKKKKKVHMSQEKIEFVFFLAVITEVEVRAVLNQQCRVPFHIYWCHDRMNRVLCAYHARCIKTVNEHLSFFLAECHVQGKTAQRRKKQVYFKMLCCSLKVEFNFSLCLSDKQVDLILCCFLYFIYLKTYWSQLKEMRQ